MMRLWVEVVTHIRIYLTRKHLTLDVCNNSEIKVILEMGKNCGKKKKKNSPKHHNYTNQAHLSCVLIIGREYYLVTKFHVCRAYGLLCTISFTEKEEEEV